MMSGNHTCTVLGVLVPVLVLPALCGEAAGAADFDPAPVAHVVAEAEARLGARVGVSVIETHSGGTWSHRGGERFPTNSTFKTFLCAALLEASESGAVDLEDAVSIQQSDIVSYSPVTEKRVGGAPVTLEDLCRITVTVSDNGAANLVMKAVGGPKGVTAYLRAIGDSATRVDRWEPDSNSGIPGDDRDTTTPDAAARSLQSLVLGSALPEAARAKLTGWLEGNTVGNATLRAGLPKDWRIADKTGAGQNGSRNNIAVIWPQGRAPVVIAIYITQTQASFDDRNKAIAEIGAALAESLTQP